MAIPLDELPAYFNAAIGVTAFKFGLSVRRLSLDVKGGRRDRPQLASLSEYIRSRSYIANPDDSTFNYVTVLLSGAVGRVIGLEEYLGYPDPHLERNRLERAYLAEAGQCREQETDSAFAIIVA